MLWSELLLKWSPYALILLASCYLFAFGWWVLCKLINEIEGGEK